MNINIMEFVNPALLVLIPLLYFIGTAIKKAVTIADKYIPLILGAVGMVLALLWVMGTAENALTAQGWYLAAFTATVQGWLCAGMSVYVNQIIKQSQKSK